MLLDFVPSRKMDFVTVEIANWPNIFQKYRHLRLRREPKQIDPLGEFNGGAEQRNSRNTSFTANSDAITWWPHVPSGELVKVTRWPTVVMKK